MITTASDGKTPIDATLPSGKENFIKKMEEYVPGCRESIEKFFALGAETLAAGNYLTASGGKPDSKVLQAGKIFELPAYCCLPSQSGIQSTEDASTGPGHHEHILGLSRC